MHDVGPAGTKRELRARSLRAGLIVSGMNRHAGLGLRPPIASMRFECRLDHVFALVCAPRR